jgi:tRNA pseudouridine38-40 synthase
LEWLYFPVQNEENEREMRNIRLTIAYDGTDFSGWQRQPTLPTIQGVLESALETILGEKAALKGAGRTDSGVHAANQVANFKSSCSIPCPNLVKALNDRLPSSVRVKEADEVPLSFHARFDVVSKTYRYRTLLSPIASPFIARFVYHHPHSLDRQAMSEAARHFEGEHDFTSFAASEGIRSGPEDKKEGPVRVTKNNFRRIHSSRLVWRPKPALLIYDVRGNGFLHHMVRNIVGTLIEVGRGALKPSDMPAILTARDRTLAGPTAPAQGLCLWKIEY